MGIVVYSAVVPGLSMVVYDVSAVCVSDALCVYLV